MPHTETWIDGIYYPSVTTILGAQEKPWLKAWREKWGDLADRKMKAAGDIGTLFHSWVEECIEQRHNPYSNSLSANAIARVEGMMASFSAWAASVDGVIDRTELKVISRRYKYSGTLDAVGTLDGKPCLYDWKTCSHIYSDMNLQLAAYAQAYKEQTGVDVKQGLIVHVSKSKPDFKLTTKLFRLGKRPLSKFLKLRKAFDEVARKEE